MSIFDRGISAEICALSSTSAPLYCALIPFSNKGIRARAFVLLRARLRGRKCSQESEHFLAVYSIQNFDAPHPREEQTAPVVFWHMSVKMVPKEVPMQIIPAKTWSQQKAFLDFPWKVYKDNPYWIPQLRLEQSGLVGFGNFGHKDPFYERNECQAFIAVDGKNVLGRICAIWNRGHIDRYNDGVGFLGFFDCIDDTSVAQGLFDAAADYLKQRDCTVLRGPVNPSLNHTLGLLIDGFNSSPKFMMTYNLPYYERLFEENGFTKTQDLYAYWGEVEMLPKVREKLLPVCEQIEERTGATVRSVDVKNFQRDVEQFLNIYNRALTNTWGFVPM